MGMRGWYFFFVGLLLLHISMGVLGSLPQVVSSSYTVESATVLGSDISLAVFTVNFDQDLYVPGITSPCREQALPCDPDSYGECGYGCDYTHSGCAELTINPNPCCMKNFIEYCITAETWVDLPNDTAVPDFLMNTESRNFRFYNPHPCDPVTVYVTLRSGLVLSYGSRIGPTGHASHEWAIPTPWRPLYHFYCPHNETSLAGTYFFAFRGKGDNAEYNVTVGSYKHEPDTKEKEPCVVPADYKYASDEASEANGTPQELTGCLQSNVPFYGVCQEKDANYLFLYKVDSCQKIHVQLSMMTIGMDADLDLLSWDYVSYLEGDDHLTMSLCGSESEPIYLTMVVSCWSIEKPSNYTIIVANQSDTTYRSVPISETFPYWEVVETAGLVRFLLPNPHPLSEYTTSDWLNTFTCTDYSFTCYQLWPVYPSADVNFFWPTPAFLVTQLRDTELDTLQLNISQANPRQRKIVNSEGLPVFGQYSATKAFPQCDYDAFMRLKEHTESLISSVGGAGDPVLLQKMQYQLDAVRFNGDWVGCANLLNSMFDKAISIYNRSTTNCFHPYQSEEWYNDGCCFTGIGWNEGCLPRYQAINIPTFSINDEASSQCNNPSCAIGLLEFYKVTLEDYYSDSSACTSTLAPSSTNYMLTTIEKYRECKMQAFTQIDSVQCFSDSDCVFGDVGSFTCNILTKKCNGDYTIQEQYFVSCLIHQMDQSQILSLQSSYSLPEYTVEDPQFVTALLSRWRSNECVGSQPLDFSSRGFYYYDNFQPDCPGTTIPPCPYIMCEDTSCALPEDTCLNFCDNFYWHYVPGSAEDNCNSQVTCNWNAELCEGMSSSDCAAACGNSFFCSVCTSDQTYCLEVPANDSTVCSSLVACLLPDGQITTSLTAEQCEQAVGCSDTCGYTCATIQDLTTNSSAPVCSFYNTTIDACQNFTGSIFYNQTGVPLCTISNISQTDCNNLGPGWTYTTCSERSVASCFEELVCGLVPVECITPGECSVAGTCTDSSVLIDVENRRYGGCMQEKSLPIDSYFRYKLLPLCEPPLLTIPNGCVDSSIVTEEECHEHEMTWLPPATSEQLCTTQMGCNQYYPELGIVGYQFAFSPKDRETCETHATGGEWKPYYTWTAAKTVYGKVMQATWRQRQTVPSHSFSSVLNFTMAYEAFLGSATAKLAIQSKSTALYSRTIQSLTAITCNCLPSSSDKVRDQCYKQIGSAVTVAQIQPCGGTEEEVVSSGLLIHFPSNSVSGAGCSDVVVSSLTASIFHDVGAVRLASSFAKLDTLPQAFAITNEHKAVVGQLLGDGVDIAVKRDVQNVLLCLDISDNEIKKEYTIFDFAYSNEDHTKLHPYGLSEAYLKNGTAVCATVNISTGSSAFLPIARRHEWEDKKFKLYDSSTTGLIYTLAVLFTVTAAMTIFTLHPQHAISVTNLLLLMVFLFTSVRSVSLYLMPSGISSSVLNYVLVVLPTFFYFTAFTLAVIIWAVLSSSVLLRPQEQIKKLGIIVNIFLYLFLIIVILVFHYTGEDAEETCGFLSAPPTYSTAQKAISILYAVVIAIISLVIGVLFLVYGYRVNEILAGATMKKNRGTKRMFIFAVIYSIFTIILVALDEPNVVFSFLGLVITEVIPSFYLSWFLASRKDDKSPGTSSNKVSNKSSDISKNNKPSVKSNQSNSKSSDVYQL